MNIQLEFLNNSFDEGNMLLNDNNIKPHKDCLGFFVETDGAGQFYWFDNEYELKHNLLNGWFARDTEEREAEYYDDVALLQVCLELNDGVDNLWKEITEKLNTEQHLLWSGHILQLLTDESNFCILLREEFRVYLVSYDIENLGIMNSKFAKAEYDKLSADKNPELLQNKIGEIPTPPKIIELLIEFLPFYFWA